MQPSEAWRIQSQFNEENGLFTKTGGEDDNMDRLLGILASGGATMNPPASSSGPQAESQSVRKLTRTSEGKPVKAVTKLQMRAIEKYPGLIDMLGEDGVGDKAAEVIGEAINSYIAERVTKNSQAIDDTVVACKPDQGRLKQYYKAGDTAGVVSAKGKFSGREYIYYDPAKAQAAVFLKQAEGWKDVSKEFELSCEFVKL